MGSKKCLCHEFWGNMGGGICVLAGNWQNTDPRLMGDRMYREDAGVLTCICFASVTFSPVRTKLLSILRKAYLIYIIRCKAYGLSLIHISEPTRPY